MEPQPVYIALGSNLEPRHTYLEKARFMLRSISKGNWVESTIHETSPVGPAGQGPYLNQVVGFLSERSPLQLLHFCKGAEAIIGRKPRGRWESREVDLDLLYCGNLLVQNTMLELPHPRIHERAFVLQPLCEIAPDWIDPRRQQTVQQMLVQLNAIPPQETP